MQLQNQDAVAFLRGANSVRDGKLVALSIHEDVESAPTVCLKFHVPRALEGSRYTLELSGALEFEYGFCSEYVFQGIAFVKCLWTNEGLFYLSLDPWREDEDFISEQDNDCFKAKSVKLIVERT